MSKSTKLFAVLCFALSCLAYAGVCAFCGISLPDLIGVLLQVLAMVLISAGLFTDRRFLMAIGGMAEALFNAFFLVTYLIYLGAYGVTFLLYQRWLIPITALSALHWGMLFAAGVSKKTTRLFGFLAFSVGTLRLVLLLISAAAMFVSARTMSYELSYYGNASLRNVLISLPQVVGALLLALAYPKASKVKPARPNYYGYPGYRETSEYQSPYYPTPNYQAPNYQAPNYQAPNYQVPDYQNTNYPTPHYQEQRCTAPTPNTTPPTFAELQTPRVSMSQPTDLPGQNEQNRE